MCRSLLCSQRNMYKHTVYSPQWSFTICISSMQGTVSTELAAFWITRSILVYIHTQICMLPFGNKVSPLQVKDLRLHLLSWIQFHQFKISNDIYCTKLVRRLPEYFINTQLSHLKHLPYSHRFLTLREETVDNHRKQTHHKQHRA